MTQIINGTTTDYLGASTATIGTVRGQGISVQAALTVTNGAYSIGDAVGGLITFANAVSGNGKRSLINSVKLAGVVAITYELWLFNADIATPAADNAALALAAADQVKFLGAIPIYNSDYVGDSASAFYNACVRGVGLQVQAGDATTSIYGYLKATATTSPGTTALKLTADFEFLD